MSFFDNAQNLFLDNVVINNVAGDVFKVESKENVSNAHSSSTSSSTLAGSGNISRVYAGV